MQQFLMKWGGWVIALVALCLLLGFKVVNERNIDQIIKGSQEAVKAFVTTCVP